MNVTIRVLMPLIAPNNFTQEVIQQPDYDHVCNQGNNFEGLEPLDPILLNPIPSNLIISVRTIHKNSQLPINNKTTCFNAQTLWDYWLSQTKNEKLDAKYANNPLNRGHFTPQSIIYLREFLENAGEENEETYKVVKDRTLYNKILDMTYEELKDELNENLFPDLDEDEIEVNMDNITNVYRVAVLNKYIEEGKL